MTESTVQYENARQELRRILTIAMPMMVSQASETVNMFVDRLFLSRLGPEQLAAAMTGGLSVLLVNSFLFGLIGYVNAIVAQYFGAARYGRCAEATAQGFWLSLAVWPFTLLTLPLMNWFFLQIGHDPQQVVFEYNYFRVLIFSSAFFILRANFTGFFLGIGKTYIVMLASITGMALNVLANYGLIFGNFGLPRLEIVGAAIGTSFGTFSGFIILLVVYLSEKYHQKYGTRQPWRFQPRLLKKLIRFGAPSGVEFFLNITVFNAFIQMMHTYGTSVAAALTICFSYDLLVFIPLLGLGFATTAVVGQHIGANDRDGAERAVYLVLKVAFAYAGVMMLVFLLQADFLVNFFIEEQSNGEISLEIQSWATIFLRLAALYTLADATQVVFAGALRGAGDTRRIMIISILTHWFFLCLAIVLITQAINPVIVWLVFILMVVCLGVLMWLRFARKGWLSIEVIEKEAVR